MPAVTKDIQFAWRQFPSRPAFTVIAVLVLALGLGATAAIFSVVNAVLLQPLPYLHPETLVDLFESDVVGNSPQYRCNSVSPGLFNEWQQHARSVSAMSAVHVMSFNISSASESFTPDILARSRVLPPSAPSWASSQRSAGSSIRAKTNTRRLTLLFCLVVFWQQHFGGETNVLGRQIRLDGENYTVVGVMPKAFVYPGQPASVLVPFKRTLDVYNRTTFSNHFFQVIGRLAPGYTVAAAQDELASIVKI